MRDFTRIPIRLDRLFLIDKQKLADALFYVGVILAFFDSLHPWFLWSLGAYGNLIIVFMLGSHFLLARTLGLYHNMGSRFVVLWGIMLLFRIYLFFIGSVVTFMTFVSVALLLAIYFVVYRASAELLKKTLVLTSKMMACLLVVSIIGFVLYVFGFSLPGRNAEYDVYSFTNYYLFLLDDRSMWAIIPRFQAVFLEPSHMAIACVFLLMTDVGNWKRWYNMVMIFAVIISFSLEAYVLSFCLVFLSKWIQRLHFMRNLLILVFGFTALVIGSFFYNDGDNMLNTLIVMRLEVDDGEVAGNNRTSATFDAEFESYLSSSDVLTGREMTEEWGNSGYKVFIYQHGLIGLFFLIMLYGCMLYNPRNTRPAMTALCLTLIHFIVRAHMMWASCIIPMYYMAQFFTVRPKEPKDECQ